MAITPPFLDPNKVHLGPGRPTRNIPQFEKKERDRDSDKLQVLIIDMRACATTGETTYLYHMKSALPKLGIQPYVISFSGFGVPYEWSAEGIVDEWIRERDIPDWIVANKGEWDVVHINNGKVGRESTYLEFAHLELISPRITMTAHGSTQIRGANLPALLELLDLETIFAVDPAAHPTFQEFCKDVVWVDLPFDPSIMPPIVRPETEQPFTILVPTRFHLIKYPGTTIEILRELATRHQFRARFFGVEERTAFMQGCLDEVRTPPEWVDIQPPFTHQQKGEVYGAGHIVCDATRIRTMQGSHRIQYVNLESMHYGLPCLVTEKWLANTRWHGVELTIKNIENMMDDGLWRCEIAERNEKMIRNFDSVKVCEVYSKKWLRTN